MDHLEAVIISLLVAVAFLSALATRIGIPYPILLVVGGLGLGFVPGIPDVRLEPDLVLVVFLPPLLYSASTPAWPWVCPPRRCCSRPLASRTCAICGRTRALSR